MRLFKLRQKLGHMGYVLHVQDDGTLVLDDEESKAEATEPELPEGKNSEE